MWSNFSIALTTLLSVLAAVFLWTIIVFSAGQTIPLVEVDIHLALRNLLFCVMAFFLLSITSQLPVRRPIVAKLMVGFGFLFLGAWQELLNTLVNSTWLLVHWMEMIGMPSGLLIASLGIYELGKAYQLNRLLLGSYRKIEHSLSTVDQLTQLYNRRYFFATCPALMQSAQKHHETPVLITLRINNLQETNHKLGYQAGDSVLIQVAKLLQKNIRTNDIASRLSGRQFALFLPNTQKEHAEDIVKRILLHAEHIDVANSDGNEVIQDLEIEYVICTAKIDESFEVLMQRARKSIKSPVTQKQSASR